MKKIFIIVAAVMIMLSLGGCMMSQGEQLTKIMGSEQQMSDQIMEAIIKKLDTRDKEGLKKLFSKPVLEEAKDLDEHMDYFMDFYNGDMVSYKGYASSQVHNNHGTKMLEFIGQYQLVTTEEIYQIGYDYKPVDDENPEEIGLRKLEIVTNVEYQKQSESEVGYYDWKHNDNGPGVYIPEVVGE